MRLTSRKYIPNWDASSSRSLRSMELICWTKRPYPRYILSWLASYVSFSRIITKQDRAYSEVGGTGCDSSSSASSSSNSSARRRSFSSTSLSRGSNSETMRLKTRPCATVEMTSLESRFRKMITVATRGLTFSSIVPPPEVLVVETPTLQSGV